MVKGGNAAHTSGTVCLETSINSLQATQRDSDTFLTSDGDQTNAELKSLSEPVGQGNHTKVSMAENAAFGSIEPLSVANCLVC